MPDVRAFIPSVDYADFLAVTLPHNRALLSEIVVVTNHEDRASVEVANEHGAHVFQTDAWTRDGAHFNGARAVEEALDAYGRHGWVMQLSADIALPAAFASIDPQVGNIYSAPRRMLEAWPTAIPGESAWSRCPHHSKCDAGLSGYMLLWNADDPHLPAPPWQPINWLHVGGSDSEFIARWPAENQHRLPLDVLHLGVPGVDWCGRVQPFADGTTHESAGESEAALAAIRDRRLHRKRLGLNRYTEERMA